ncbi:MAG: hypothetical protein K2G44_03425 [Clostridia bacterium]|nr:hypothetical protein [Clostridia bacterium]
MNVLKYIICCLFFEGNNWYDFFVSIAIYAVILGILFLISIPIKRYQKEEKERIRKEKGLKYFINPDEKLDEKIIEANIKKNTKNMYSNENGNNRDFINKK